MKLAVFLELIEAKAKTASVFPFLLGSLYAFYTYGKLNLIALSIYFIAMLLFNCFVDAWDNYNDFHHAHDVEDYKVNTNIIGREKIPEKTMVRLLGFLFFTSFALGLVVAWMTGWPVFWIGLGCYAVGIFYSGGPHPLSRLPFGEVLSGVTMGFLIVLLSVFINVSEQFSWDFTTIQRIFEVSLPSVLLIANLMLANNTSDLEEDRRNHRYTLVHYIGKKHAVTLWVVAVISAYVFLLHAALVGITPILMVGNLFTIPFVYLLMKPYVLEQKKQTTFLASVKILALLSFTQVLFFLLGIILR
ncbi:MAG: prenyltransferase [Streptococcaceae bacterium]|nr:prenyltransferase [Streptococcaceae bacterium]